MSSLVEMRRLATPALPSELLVLYLNNDWLLDTVLLFAFVSASIQFHLLASGPGRSVKL